MKESPRLRGVSSTPATARRPPTCSAAATATARRPPPPSAPASASALLPLPPPPPPRACLPSPMAASSSTAAAGPFPAADETVRFLCRSQAYKATVHAVRHEAVSSTVHLKVTGKTPRRRFSAGEPATLQAADGARWAGKVADPYGEGFALLADSLYTWVFVRLPAGELTGIAYDCFLNVYPFHRQLVLNTVEWEVEIFKESNTMFKLKVGLIGFGSIGRQIAEALVDMKDIDLIAICDDLTSADMVLAWKSSKFSLRGYGGKSLIFNKKTTELVQDNGILVSVLNPREHEKSPWGYLQVNYVIDTLSLFSEDRRVVYSAHDRIDPPSKDGIIDTNLPKQLSGPVYTMMYDDEGVPNGFNPTMKYIKFSISVEDVKKFVVENVPEWRSGSANICFSTECDPTKRICDPLTELHQSNNEEAEQREERGRFISVLSCCIQILKRVAIGGVFLMF